MLHPVDRRYRTRHEPAQARPKRRGVPDEADGFGGIELPRWIAAVLGLFSRRR